MKKGEESKYFKYNNDIVNLWNEGEQENFSEIARLLIDKYKLSGTVNSVRLYVQAYIRENFQDKEIIQENVKLSKQKQRAQDQNRIANKSFREYARVENAIADYGKSLAEINKEYAKELKKIKFVTYKSQSKDPIGVIHITDVHGNELINLPNNKYDFQIMAKRMKKHICESLSYFKYRKVKKVLIALTADLINSDRRLDEVLSASTNRSKASIIMIHVLKQVICDVRKEYNVSIISVLGNESRVNKEMTFSNEALSDNYDFTIVAQLKQMFDFAQIKGVNFLGYSNVQEVVKIGEQHWLIAHNLSRMLDSQKETQAAIGMQFLKGQGVDFIIGGHIHATRITDISARSASMAGSNAYNENALGLIGRASHNCYVVDGKERYIQVNDIQDVDNVVGYDVLPILEAYNAKSVNKLSPNETVLIIPKIII